jgi:hypothetical protein
LAAGDHRCLAAGPECHAGSRFLAADASFNGVVGAIGDD